MELDRVTSTAIRRRVVLNTASNLVAKLFTLVLGFLVTPFILSRLGVQEYGLWMLVGLVISYGSLLDLGIGLVVYAACYLVQGANLMESVMCQHFIAGALRSFNARYKHARLGRK